MSMSSSGLSSLRILSSGWLTAALVVLGLSADASAQPNSTGTVVLGRAADDGPTLPTYSMPVGCSASIAAQNCQVTIAKDAAFTQEISKDEPRTEWGLRKDTTYYVRVQSWAFMNGSIVRGPFSPVVTYKYSTPPKLPATFSTNEVAPAALSVHDCSGVKGTKLQSPGGMRAGDLMRSPNKRYEVTYQHDGNLVVYELTPQRKAIWANGKQHNNPSWLRVQPDGNITIKHLESNGRLPVEVLVWETKTAGHDQASLVIQDDGNLVVYDAKDGCKAWWASKSSR